MISIVVYGRNDNHGYNLHKRAALSLNCMAEVLADSSDEILFVDYNTPDDFPTFPEAIQDTLTKRVRGMLRILRVRPRIHERYKSKTSLPVLEPIARNVAVRRSSPSNRWILSTNTDIIFCPRDANTLSEIARGLAPGFYHAPRLEVPEMLWESFDRQAPNDIIGTVRDWGSTLHLNEIVLGLEFFRYDGPGDFQLLLRSDLFENQGFHEGMLLGWHVDANIAKRMYVKYGMVGDLADKVYGYHCDHTRQVTPLHSYARIQNDWRRFCVEVEEPDIPEQADTWGCVNDTIEEIRLLSNPIAVYVQALREAVGSPLDAPQFAEYTAKTYNQVNYDPRHMVTFLADMFLSMPKAVNLGWYGAGIEMLSRFATVWNKLGFTGELLVDQELLQQKQLARAVLASPSENMLDDADVFVFDFGNLPGPIQGVYGSEQLTIQLQRRLLQVVREERRRLSFGKPLRRVIALNAINNKFEGLVRGFVAAAATPIATHMRHGFVMPAVAKEEWLGLLDVGPAGMRVEDQIKSDPRHLGVIATGPNKYLDEGRYLLLIRIELSVDGSCRYGNEPCVSVEVFAGRKLLGLYLIRREAMKRRDHLFYFYVPGMIADIGEGVETRVRMLAQAEFSIRALTIESVEAASIEADHGVAACSVENWLPFLLKASGTDVDRDGVVVSENGGAGYPVFGPYWTLPAGRYEMIASISPHASSRDTKPVITGDVVSDSGRHVLATCQWHLGRFECGDGHEAVEVCLPFTLADDLPEALRTIETRIFSPGNASFSIRSMAVRVRSDEPERNWFPYLMVGEAGIQTSREIKSVQHNSGYMASTPAMEITPGHYQLFPNVVAVDADGGDLQETACIALEVWSGPDLIAIGARAPGQDQPLEFDVTEELAARGVELHIRALTPTVVAIRGLRIEKTSDTAAPTPIPAVLRLQDWLPFLQRSPSAHADEEGLVVSEGGGGGFAVYGPYWTLPAGRYEMVALIVPQASSGNSQPVITGDVVSDSGQRVLATSQWPLGRFESGDGHEAVEVRLPFTLADDLPAASRTIETRVNSPGDANFRIRSLAVRVRSDEPERNWFPYLMVGEAGIHTGREIKSIAGNFGSMAATPAMEIAPGHYRLFPNVVAVDADGGDLQETACIALETWSGPDLIAIGAREPAQDQPLEFDVTEELAARGIKLSIRALTSAVISIRGLFVEKTLDTAIPSRVPAGFRLENWLPFLWVGTAGRRIGPHVVTDPGKVGYVVYGPYWPLPPGHYGMVIVVSSARPGLASMLKHYKNIRKAWASIRRPFLEGVADVMVNGRQVAMADKFVFDHAFSRFASVRLSFEIASEDVKNASSIETRVLTSGRADFRICSITVKRRM